MVFEYLRVTSIWLGNDVYSDVNISYNTFNFPTTNMAGLLTDQRFSLESTPDLKDRVAVVTVS